MVLMNLIGWWYGKGFVIRLKGLGSSLGRTADGFSIGLMLKTLFSPFRQIDAGVSGKGVGEAFQAFLSRLISRLVGFVARTVMIVAGLVTLILQSIMSFLIIVLHLAIPVLPIAGIVMMVAGWVPEMKWW